MTFTHPSAGFVVVIDDFWDPNLELDYRTLLSLPHIHKIILYPGQGETHQRNLKRFGESPDCAYIDEGIEIVQLMLDRCFIEYEGQSEEYPMTGRWIFKEEFQLLLRLAEFNNHQPILFYKLQRHT